MRASGFILACSISLIISESLLPYSNKLSKREYLAPNVFRSRVVGKRIISLRGGNSSTPHEGANCQQNLINAVKENNQDEVDESIQLGADPNFQDSNGMSALHYAATEGNLHLFKILTARGGCFQTQSKDGSTSLHLAAYYGHENIVKFIMEEGGDNAVDANVKDLDGSTPLHNAAYRGQCACATVLLDHGADVNVCQVSITLHFLTTRTTKAIASH
jgi:ankyrin repeat protein